MAAVTFSGLASGIDTDSLIKATIDAEKKIKVTPKQDRIDKTDAESTSLNTLKTNLTELKTLLQKFTTLGGGGVAKQATSSNDANISGTATSAASPGVYSVTVNQRAKNATGSFASSFASTTAQFASGPGTYTFDIGTGSNLQTFNVPVTAATTVDEFVSAFNSATTLAVASTVQVSSGVYKVVISSTNTGLDKGQIVVTEPGALVPPGVWSVSQALNSNFDIAGVATGIERSSNTVADVIEGVTLSLNASTYPASADITIGTDSATTQSNIQEFVDKWNEIVDLLAEENKIERDESSSEVKNIFGSLAATRVDDNALSSLRTALSSAGYSDGSEVKIFADLGIKTERDGTLAFDTEAFNTKIALEPESINSLFKDFADEVASTSGTIDQYARFAGLIDITVNANKEEVSNLNEQISRAEAQLLQKENSMRQRFASLESLTSRLQAQQAQLSSSLASLG